MDTLKHDNLSLYADFARFCRICDGTFGSALVPVTGALGGIYRNVNINNRYIVTYKQEHLLKVLCKLLQ